MPRFLVHHHHESPQCGIAFAAFKGHQSPLRRQTALASCASGGHEIWWVVEAASEAQARALLPFFVAQRSSVIPVTEVQIP
jgi:hypothetical protein